MYSVFSRQQIERNVSYLLKHLAFSEKCNKRSCGVSSLRLESGWDLIHPDNIVIVARARKLTQSRGTEERRETGSRLNAIFYGASQVKSRRRRRLERRRRAKKRRFGEQEVARHGLRRNANGGSARGLRDDLTRRGTKRERVRVTRGSALAKLTDRPREKPTPD